MEMTTTETRSQQPRGATGTELMIDKVDVWVAPLMDCPGGLAEKLEALTEAGADLQFVLARRAPERPEGGVVFVTPLRSDHEVEAAADEGFTVSRSLQSLRIEGPDRPGIVSALLRNVAGAGISLQGLSAAVLGTRFVVYVSLDSKEDAQRAVDILTAS